MTPLAIMLIAVLLVWMTACVWTGYGARAKTFAVVLGVGLALNMAWMMIGLDAHVLEPHALVAEAAIALYGISAFGFGWLIGRVKKAWRESAVETGVS